MNSKRSLSPVLVALAIALVSAFAAGCGDDAGSASESAEASVQPSKAFTQLLAETKQAALAGKSFDARKQAKNLDGAERATVDAFCETVWQLEINDETAKLERTPYIVGRIRNFAELGMGVAYVPGRAELPDLTAALGELRKTVDISSLNKKSNHDYKRACYG